MTNHWVRWLAVALAAWPAIARGEQIVLVSDGVPAVAIYVDADVMAPDVTPPPTTWSAKQRQAQRQRLRESVHDLALYLKKISGAQVKIVTAAPASNDPRLAILIGDLATARFGPPRIKAPFRQGFRFVLSPQGIGLGGESDLATSYAIYELLDRLGCRWYMPSALGEVVARKKTVRLPATDESLAPGTTYRRIIYADEDFKRRTRQGGLQVRTEHALEIRGYVTKEQLDKHPQWCALIDGKRTPKRFCWSNPQLADAVADGIITRVDKSGWLTISLSPNDGVAFCQCDSCKALDADDWDPSMGMVSITDRYIHFCNRVAERVTKENPDLLLGFLAYVQYTRPPVREKLHPNLVPNIAPITYCRAHTFLQADQCPSRTAIRQIVEGWGKVAKNVCYYNYMFHLAEVTVPYPMIRQMSDELPLLYANGVKYWQPETLPNFDSVLPGLVLAMRMSWNTKADPAKVLDEFYTDYYGAAAASMRRYWQLFDDAWTTVPEHAGCGFGYPRRFTPTMLKQARGAMNGALAACATDGERRRVKLHDDALTQFELFMKLRRDLFEGRLTGLRADSDRFLRRQLELAETYADQYAFGKVHWTKRTVGGEYFSRFFKKAYDDAARIAKRFNVIRPPLRQWRYQVDRKNKGEALGWQRAGFDDHTWKTTDPCVDTWFTLGLDDYFGSVFYRTTVAVPDASTDKNVYLWISSTDGSVKVFVNGRHIPYVDANGQTKDVFSGYCTPASFDITSAIGPGRDNQITIIGSRLYLNELGTGGLLGPVYLYRD